MLTSVEEVRAAEKRVHSDRKYANELIALLDASEDDVSHRANVRLSALQSCRALFQGWAEGGELPLRVEEPSINETELGSSSDRNALAAYHAWLLRSYRRFIGSLQQLLGTAKAPLALRLSALDSLILLASLEARHSRANRPHPSALDAAGGAYRAALDGLMGSRKPPPEELLVRLRDTHLPHLDAAYFLLEHLRRCARASGSSSEAGLKPERILELLLLVTPPSEDIEASNASLLCVSDSGMPPTGSRKRKAPAEESVVAKSWPPELRQLLGRKRHRTLFCKTWRALLSLPLPSATFRAVLRNLPETVFPHSPRPLVYCDLLSDGYSRGGVDAVLALRGLFVLMTRHNLEYPRFYARLYGLLTRDNLCGAHRSVFAEELKTFLSSSGLPAYVTCAFAKRLARLALNASPSGAAIGLGLVFNLLLQHKAARVLVHRTAGTSGADEEGEGVNGDVADGGEGEDEEKSTTADGKGDGASAATGDALTALVEAAASADPFIEEEEEPEACGAINSCLWEVDQLRSHCCPLVASLASLFMSPVGPTTPPVDLEPLSAMTYASLGQLETRKKLRDVPIAMRAPKALFGAHPDAGETPGEPLTAGLAAWE
jgi:U3 small nucleolar RNA-associated protein 19